MSAEIKWIKISTGLFDDEKIKLIEAMPAADTIITIWFKLLILAGQQNNNGVFMFNSKIAYTDEMLSVIFRRSVESVRLALATFETYEMIEIIDGVVTIPNWEKHQSLDAYEAKKEYDRKYQQERRDRQKQLVLEAQKLGDEKKSYDVIRCKNDNRILDIDIDKEKDIDKENINNISNVRLTLEYTAIFDVWNEQKIIIHKELNEARKKAIKKSLKNYKCEDITLAIKHYGLVLNSNWRFSYKWSLEDFLNRSNGLPNFMDEGSIWNSFQDAVKENPFLLPSGLRPQTEIKQNPLIKDLLNRIK